jgi:hypothetical protein
VAGLILAIWLKAKITPKRSFTGSNQGMIERRLLVHAQFDENGNFILFHG